MELADNLNVITEDFKNLFRLPDSIKPDRYKLTLDPDLEGSTFTGDIIIDIEVIQTTRTIFLNSHELTVTSARVCNKLADGSSTEAPVIGYSIERVNIQKQRQLLVICLENSLSPGLYSVLLSYTGRLNNESCGFYRTWISSSGGSPRYCAATYFEPTYARFAFPCFDEPHLKAKYAVSLVKPSRDDYVALSNSSVKVEVVNFPRPGVTMVHFNETPPISSYLTCFIVGVFQCLEPATALSGQLPISVYSQPDLIEQTAFSRDLAAKILDYFSEYFQIDYPFPKLDLIAIPDSKLSGMENWGLITFRETALLLSPDETSTSDLLTVVRIVVHELSHMWFGNLVTIAWWNDTWLKEGMADFMSYIGGNFAFPSWYTEWVFLNTQVLPALQKDSALSSHPIVLKVSHPDQIREMFDTISYRKGSCIIRMLHDIDPPKFRRGLMNYVTFMKWSNASTIDLWQKMSEAMGWHVGDIMGPWTEQMGYPLITVSKQGKEFVLTQKRFLTDKTSTYNVSTSPYKYVWDIPIKYFTSKDKNKVEFMWFHRDNDSAHISCSHDTEWIKLNWHYVGFYRVNYSDELWNSFAHLLSKDLTVFDPEDRCSLINDAFCLASAGYVGYNIPMKLIKYLQDAKEDNYLVWSVVKDHLKKLQALLSSSNSVQLFNTYMQKLVEPVVSTLNWDTSENVPFMERKLRRELISLTCLIGLKTSLEKIRMLFSDWIEKKKPQLNVEIRSIVHSYGLSEGTSDDLWERTWQCFLEEQDPREVLNLLRSLSSTSNPNLLTRLLNEAKNPDVIRSQDFFHLLRFMSRTHEGNNTVWSFIRNEWTYLVSRFTLNDYHLGKIVGVVSSYFCSEEQLLEVEEFFTKYPDAGAGTSERKHTLETIKANIRRKNENNEFLEKWFGKVQ